MKLHRNLILRWLGLWLLLNLVIFTVACTTAWTAEATRIIALLVPAVEAALGIISAFGVGIAPDVITSLSKWATEAQHDLTVVASLIDQYNQAEAGAKPGILDEIKATISIVSTNLKDILPAVHVTDPQKQAEVMAVVNAISSELDALIALVPALQGQVTSHHELKALMAALKSPEEFKSDFNAKAGVFGREYELQ